MENQQCQMAIQQWQVRHQQAEEQIEMFTSEQEN